MRTQEEIEAILDKVESLLGEFSTAEDNHNRSEWSKKFGDRLSKYQDKLHRMNGDDFDVLSSSYDEYHKDYSDMTDDEYMDALEENIKKVIKRMWPETPDEEVEQVASEAVAETDKTEPEAEVTITAETEPETEDKTTSDEDCKEKDETIPEEVKDATEATPTKADDVAVKAVEALDETPEVDEGDDLEAFTKELEEYKKRG